MLARHQKVTTRYNLLFALYLSTLQESESTKHHILSAIKESVLIQMRYYEKTSTRYGLEGPGIESLWGGEIFSIRPNRPWLSPNPL